MTNNFENVNHLVLNFYPDGYTIAVKLNEFPVFTSETILETAKISYEETSLLDYIENEELPPLLVEMIDGSPKLSQYKIWHNGCLLLEVRDKTNIGQDVTKSNFRFCNNQATAKEYSNNNYSPSQKNASWLLSQSLSNYDNIVENQEATNSSTNGSYFIILKPTNLSMLYDVLNLTESSIWSTQDRLQLESQIVLHNSPPLFLEPDATKQPPEQNSHRSDIRTSNIYTKQKKRLPHTKLMSIYPNKAGYVKSNNGGSNGGNGGNNGGNKISRNTVYHQPVNDYLPPELTLQQFLATQRTKKITFSTRHLPKFHRFKKHLIGNSK